MNDRLSTRIVPPSAAPLPVERAPWSGLHATLTCPTCGRVYRVRVGEHQDDQPGNRYPALWLCIKLPCGHALPLEYDAEHQSCNVMAS